MGTFEPNMLLLQVVMKTLFAAGEFFVLAKVFIVCHRAIAKDIMVTASLVHDGIAVKPWREAAVGILTGMLADPFRVSLTNEQCCIRKFHRLTDVIAVKVTGADEVMLATQIYDHDARLRSYEIGAEVCAALVDAEAAEPIPRTAVSD